MDAPFSLPEVVNRAIEAWRSDYSFVGIDPLPKGAHGAALSTRLVEAVQSALRSVRDVEIEQLVEENNALDARVKFLEGRATPANLPLLDELEEAYLVLAVLARKLQGTVSVTKEDREAAAKSELNLDHDEESGTLTIELREPDSLARSLEQST